MEIGGLKCSGCGSTNVEFDAKRRIITCHTCGFEQYYNRATMGAGGKIAFARQNAIKFFKEGKFEEAQRYALDVLNASKENVPAQYVLAFYSEFGKGQTGAMRDFFNRNMEEPLEYDEVQDMKELFLISAPKLQDFEPEIIQIMAANMQSHEDADELGEFIDSVCPYFIAKRTSMDFFTKELAEMYRELAEHCGIPKTCFALLKAMEQNPDSPYASRSFFLESKTRYFFDHFVGPVGEILGHMKNGELRGKFLSSYQIKCEQYRKDAGYSK